MAGQDVSFRRDGRAVSVGHLPIPVSLTVWTPVRFGKEMDASFMRDLENSRQIEFAQWQQRSVLERIEEAISGRLEPLL